MMFCAKCGKDLLEGTKFCGGCGEKVDSPSVGLSSETGTETVTEPASQEPAYAATSEPAYVAPQPTYMPQQPAYAAPRPNQQGVEPLSVGNYIGTMLLLSIPLVGFILLLIWAFDSSTNINKRNYARAILLMGVIAIVLIIAFWAIIIGFASSLGRMF